jgi:mannose/fructose/N-acetylgalactosamine-specific phosphotransferase system component IIC
MLLQCILGAAAMLLPGLLTRRVGLNIPSAMIIAYAVFLYCAIYLGEVRSFYYNIPHWDTILHTFSGAALGALGFSLISLLNKSESITFSLSPIFVAMFAFCFAVSLGVLWEIYEFSMDYVLGTNMQKYALESGENLIGQAALTDTMKDLIVDAIGAFAVSVTGYISLKYKKGWFEKFQLKYSKTNEKSSENPEI